MKPLLVGTACALVLPLAVGGLVSFIDTTCFPDLVYENMGYEATVILRLVPLLTQSVLTGCVISQVLAARGRAAGWTGLIGGSTIGFLLLLLCRSDYSAYVPSETIGWRIRATFFDWGEYLIWARSRAKRTSTSCPRTIRKRLCSE